MNSTAEEDINRAVESAIAGGVSVAQFIEEAARVWDWALRDKIDRDARRFSKTLQTGQIIR
jgi:hypothetical protein